MGTSQTAFGDLIPMERWLYRGMKLAMDLYVPLADLALLLVPVARSGAETNKAPRFRPHLPSGHASNLLRPLMISGWLRPEPSSLTSLCLLTLAMRRFFCAPAPIP